MKKHPLARRLVTHEDAVPMKTQHRKPCADCPFARTAMKGWLGLPQKPEAWTEFAHGEMFMQCHCTTNMQCAGAAIFRANVCKVPKDARHLQCEPNTELVFADDKEFIQHHTK